MPWLRPGASVRLTHPTTVNMQRRDFLRCAGCATGSALCEQLAFTARIRGGHALAPRAAHHPARAKQLIFVFLTGGFSHVDTFDYKPRLQANHRRMVQGESLREASRQPLLASPFRFERYGESGLTVSELFPNLGALADDLCVIRTMRTDILEHFQAALAMHTGSSTVPMPSIGAWLSYGLGTLNPNLPPYVVLAEHLPYAGAQVWDSSFLPPEHQGTRLLPGAHPLPDLKSPARSVTLAELEAVLLEEGDRAHAAARPGDPNLPARIQSFHTARGMMREAPQVFDLSKEDDATLEMYGIRRGDDRSFAWQCLMARRLVERGVRTVELIDTGAGDNWDSHGNMQ